MTKKVLIILFAIVSLVILSKWNKADMEEIKKITTDCVENSQYSEKVCKGYAFALVKEGKDTLLHYEYINK